MTISRFALLLFAFSLSVTQPALTQNPASTPTDGTADESGTPTFHSNVPLVVLDVVVTDAHGTPVTNLTRADFHIEENKDPQTVLNFEQAGARVPNAAVNIDSTAALDRAAPQAPVQIIVLDEFNTRFEDMAFARYSLKKFLQKQPGKLSTPTMLIAVDLQHFTVLHDYTQNKDDIIKSRRWTSTSSPTHGRCTRRRGSLSGTQPRSSLSAGSPRPSWGTRATRT